MFRQALLISIVVASAALLWAQNTQTPTGRNQAFDLAQYGVTLQPDARLIVVMAALDAAGYDPTPQGRQPSAFRSLVRKDQASLDPALRDQMKEFLERHKLPPPATPADQAARYVSLAYVLAPPPTFDTPDRADDLPGGALEVLDFAPLLREFYRKSGIDERMPSYVRAYQAEADRLRRPTEEMVRSALSYLHTQPVLVTVERVRVKSPDKKKSSIAAYEARERPRRFFIVPDLLAAPGAINFRVIADDYYAVVPEGIDPTASELRRAYFQFVLDPLVLKFNRDIAAQREEIKKLIDARARDDARVSPDPFIVVSRSLVAAADVRFEEAEKLAAVTELQKRYLQQAKDDTTRKTIAARADAARKAIADEATARLAENYEDGSIMVFFFADRLRELQASGFDIGNLFGEMLTGFDPARESKRLASAAEARDRALAARKAHPRYSVWLINPDAETREAAETARGSELIKSLKEVETLLQTRHYDEAEARVKELLQQYPGDARLFFTMAQTSSLWARDTTDDNLQVQRLSSALSNYRLAITAANPETEKVLLSRAHEAMGRILAFLDHNDEAMKEFEAAIKVGDVPGGAYRDAVEGKRKLTAQP
jgi:hypothetical protein